MYFWKGMLIIFAVLFVFASPVAYFLGVMATDDPNGPWWAFWAGFFFIEGIPTLLILVSLIIMTIIKLKKRKII